MHHLPGLHVPTYNLDRTDMLDKERALNRLTCSPPGAIPCLGRLNLSVHTGPRRLTSALHPRCPPKGSLEPRLSCKGHAPGLWWLPAGLGQEGLMQPPRVRRGLLTRLAASLSSTSGPGFSATRPGNHYVLGSPALTCAQSPAQGERGQSAWPGWDRPPSRQGRATPHPHPLRQTPASSGTPFDVGE